MFFVRSLEGCLKFWKIDGILKAGEFRLGKLIKEKINTLIHPSHSERIDVILKNSSTKYENGVSFPKRVCIQLLSEEDGKTDILDTAKRIASDYSQRNIEMKDISTEHINKCLKATENIPDPDLAVQFGPTYSLMGFLPWQTRLTEILHVGTLRNIGYTQYFEVLQKYSKCNQRFGK